MPRDPHTRPALVARHRQRLFEMLGGECALCATDGDACDGPLEADHPFGRDWVPREVSSYQRNLRYLREAAEGKLRLLCRHHNQTVRPRKLALTTNQPF